LTFLPGVQAALVEAALKVELVGREPQGKEIMAGPLQTMPQREGEVREVSGFLLQLGEVVVVEPA
jgi:hypothetical protein